jgi:hypothetical protein
MLDEHLLAALRHAPDAHALPDELLSARILAAGRQAAARSRPWWQRWLGSGSAYAWGGAGSLAAALLAATVLYVGRDEVPKAESSTASPQKQASAAGSDRAAAAPVREDSAAESVARAAPPPAPVTARPNAERRSSQAADQAAPVGRVEQERRATGAGPRAPAPAIARPPGEAQEGFAAAPAPAPAPAPATTAATAPAAPAPPAPALADSPPKPSPFPAQEANRARAAAGEAAAARRQLAEERAERDAAGSARAAPPAATSGTGAPTPGAAPAAPAATPAAPAAAAGPRLLTRPGSSLAGGSQAALLERWSDTADITAWRWRGADGAEGPVSPAWLRSLLAATEPRLRTTGEPPAGAATLRLRDGNEQEIGRVALRAARLWACDRDQPCELREARPGAEGELAAAWQARR